MEFDGFEFSFRGQMKQQATILSDQYTFIAFIVSVKLSCYALEGAFCEPPGHDMSWCRSNALMTLTKCRIMVFPNIGDETILAMLDDRRGFHTGMSIFHDWQTTKTLWVYQLNPHLWQLNTQVCYNYIPLFSGYHAMMILILWLTLDTEQQNLFSL